MTKHPESTPQAEADRLAAYHPFDQDVLERVSEAAEYHRSITDWRDIDSQLPGNQVFMPTSGLPVEVLDINPDGADTLVYHSSMGNGLDAGLRSSLFVVAMVKPETRIVAFGNIGGPGRGLGKLSKEDRETVRSGYYRPVIEPGLQYLKRQGVEQVAHVGHSYGVPLSLTASEYASNYDQFVTDVVAIDAPDPLNRSLPDLALSFAKTGGPLKAYVKAANSPAFNQARKHAGRKSFWLAGYGLGLVRPTNVAAAIALTHGKHEVSANRALRNEEYMRLHDVWGTLSELAINQLMVEATDRLITSYGPDRVTATAISGQKHNMVNDPFLHAAIIAQNTK